MRISARCAHPGNRPSSLRNRRQRRKTVRPAHPLPSVRLETRQARPLGVHLRAHVEHFRHRRRMPVVPPSVDDYAVLQLSPLVAALRLVRVLMRAGADGSGRVCLPAPFPTSRWSRWAKGASSLWVAIYLSAVVATKVFQSGTTSSSIASKRRMPRFFTSSTVTARWKRSSASRNRYRPGDCGFLRPR